MHEQTAVLQDYSASSLTEAKGWDATVRLGALGRGKGGKRGSGVLVNVSESPACSLIGSFSYVCAPFFFLLASPPIPTHPPFSPPISYPPSLSLPSPSPYRLPPRTAPFKVVWVNHP